MRTPARFSSEVVAVLTLFSALLLIGCGGGGSSIAPPLPPSFSISISQANLSMAPGTTATVNVSLVPQNGFTGAVNITVSNLPMGVTTSPPSPISLTSGSQMITFSASASTADGNYTVSLQGTSGSLSASTNIALSIAPLASFALSSPQNNVLVRQGSSVSVPIGVSLGNGATNYTLQFSISGLPLGVNGAFSGNSVSPNGQENLSLAASANAPGAQGIPLTVTATRSVDSAQQTLQLLLGVSPAVGELPSSRTDFVRTDESISSAVFDDVHNQVFASVPVLSTVFVISAATHQTLKRIPVPGARGLSLSPDGTQVLVGNRGSRLSWIDTSSLQIVKQTVLPLTQPNCPCNPAFIQAQTPVLLSTGKVLILGQSPFFNGILIWDPQLNTLVERPIGPLAGATGIITSSRDGSKVLASDNATDGAVFLYDASSDSFTTRQFGSPAFAVAANPNGTNFAVAVDLQTINIVDANLNTIATVQGAGGPTNGLVYSPDGRFLYVLSAPGNIPVISTIDTRSYEVLGAAPATATNIAYVDREPPLFVETPLASDNTGMVFGAADHGLALDDATFFQSFSSSTSFPTFAIIADPAEGPLNTATSVSITTQSFADVPDVWFGNQRGTNVSLNGAGQIAQVTAPPSSTPGPVNIRIFDVDGTVAMIPQAFTYGEFPVSYGSLAAAPAGTVTADLYGYGFSIDSPQPSTQVQIGSQNASIASATFFPAESISFGYPFPLQHLHITVPSGQAGVSDISITSPSGKSVVKQGFHYLASVKDYSSPDKFTDVLYDQGRAQLYLSAGDHIDVFSLTSATFQPPIVPPILGKVSKVAGLALTPDGSKLIAANFADDSIAIIDFNSPSSSQAVPIVSPGGATSLSPIHVATTSLNTVFIDAASTTGVQGGGGAIYTLDLATLAVSQASAPGFLQAAGNSICASRDGSVVALASVGGGDVDIWKATTNSWTGHGDDVNGNDAAISRDASMVSVSQPGLPFFLDLQDNILGVAGLPLFLNPGGLNSGNYVTGHRLHDSGALDYIPGFQNIDIFDSHHGDLRERVFLSEQIPQELVHAMDIDENGERIFLLSNSVLTVIQLDSVPLSVGYVSPSSASAGTTFNVRGSGFVQGTTVTVNGVAATSTFVDKDTLKFVLPSLASGPVQLMLTNPSGETYSLDNALAAL
jgi:hypothetical protein